MMEEWRQQRSASGRAMEALWKFMHDGSVVAERMPIGLESIIQGVSIETCRGFYRKWYHPHHMAVIVVGDFEVRCSAIGHPKPLPFCCITTSEPVNVSMYV